MDESIVEAVHESKKNKPTDKLVELYKKRSSSYSDEFFEAIRQILVQRGVTDESLDLSPPPINSPHAERTRPAVHRSSGHGWFAFVGGLAGGLVGYLTGTSPLLSFGDVLTRGVFLEGIKALMRPAAEAASNYMLAGAVAGIVAGLGLASLISSQGTPRSTLETETRCRHCGMTVPNEMRFCGKCGNSLAPVVCRQCGKALPPDQQFCGGCGTRV
ncbi:MAG: zinc ribbon domain-containing protein [Bryobacteraceae bacterium]|jgi:predicted nucleic acid-binding Zn ribbon protein